MMMIKGVVVLGMLLVGSNSYLNILDREKRYTLGEKKIFTFLLVTSIGSLIYLCGGGLYIA